MTQTDITIFYESMVALSSCIAGEQVAPPREQLPVCQMPMGKKALDRYKLVKV
jgi:hypothetical protein